jgi:hypothetical protein
MLNPAWFWENLLECLASLSDKTSGLIDNASPRASCTLVDRHDKRRHKQTTSTIDGPFIIMNNFLENQCMIVPEEKLSIFPELNFYLEKIFNIISSHKSDFTHITMVN